jgi:hypothetical protein
MDVTTRQQAGIAEGPSRRRGTGRLRQSER